MFNFVLSRFKPEPAVFEVSASQPSTIRTQGCLISIPQNVFVNARGFPVTGKVKLEITVGRGEAVITVSDNGIGIPEKSISQIFNMFYRATSEELGSGFGLYNVKDALSKLNGKIDVESKENEGTTFKVVIPSK